MNALQPRFLRSVRYIRRGRPGTHHPQCIIYEKQTAAGLIAIWSQTMCLTIAAAALWYQELWTDRADLGIGLFVGAVGLSRFGLYMFDVAAAQLFQVRRIGRYIGRRSSSGLRIDIIIVWSFLLL